MHDWALRTLALARWGLSFECGTLLADSMLHVLHDLISQIKGRVHLTVSGSTTFAMKDVLLLLAERSRDQDVSSAYRLSRYMSTSYLQELRCADSDLHVPSRHCFYLAFA